MTIIGFGHRRRAGKDTASNFCVTHLRATTKRKLIVKSSFATKMKAICHDLYSWAGLRDGDYYEAHPELKEQVIPLLGKSPRQIYIEMGTSVGRSIYKDTWLQYVLKASCDFNIIADVRFANEADAILDAGGRVYKVHNPNVPVFNDVADTALDSYDKWSGIIVNDGDLNKFHASVMKEVFNV